MEPKQKVIIRKLEKPEVLDNKELAYFEQIIELRMVDIDSGKEFIVDRRRQLLQGDREHIIAELDEQQVKIDETHKTYSDEIKEKREQIGEADARVT